MGFREVSADSNQWGEQEGPDYYQEEQDCYDRDFIRKSYCRFCQYFDETIFDDPEEQIGYSGWNPFCYACADNFGRECPEYDRRTAKWNIENKEGDSFLR